MWQSHLHIDALNERPVKTPWYQVLGPQWSNRENPAPMLRTILGNQVPVDICPDKATAQQRVDNALSSVQYSQ